MPEQQVDNVGAEVAVADTAAAAESEATEAAAPSPAVEQQIDNVGTDVVQIERPPTAQAVYETQPELESSQDIDGGGGDFAAAGRPHFAEEQSYRMPDTIVSSVYGADGEQRDIFIAIERTEERKPYMGGLRDTNSGRVYHHAYTQTPVERVSKWENAPPRFTREVQTSKAVTRSQQVKREGAAQTKRGDIHEDKVGYRELAPRPYFTSDQLMAVWHANALKIQCQWRGSLARKRAIDIKLELQRQVLAGREAQRQAAIEANRQMQRDIERRMHPRSDDDFGVLYDEVEAWRLSETARIESEQGRDEKGRRAAMSALIAKESVLVATIERLRLVANKENREERIRAMMAQMAAPQTWGISDGEVVSVMTPFATRAKELKDLYQGLCDTGAGAGASSPAATSTSSGPYATYSSLKATQRQQQAFTKDDRLDVLLHVKYTVKEFDCALTREIVQLIDRETDMLTRNRPAASLDGLRTRLKSMFRLFCEDPAFNPNAAMFNKLPASQRDPRMLPSFLQPVAKKY